MKENNRFNEELDSMEKIDFLSEIKRLKEEKNALILAHYYEVGEVQDVADFVGDSLALAKMGESSDADMLIVCGVKFMAESSKILSKDKKVLIPNMDAGCPMADMVTGKALETYKRRHPETLIVSYVNTSAEVKALTDICVTSSNALSIIDQLESQDILFLPDQNLGSYINRQLEGVSMKLWDGYCRVHHHIDKSSVEKVMKEHPKALVLAHPECTQEVLSLADYIGSTKGILNYAKESEHEEFVIVTEEGILHALHNENPNKKFFLANGNITCKNMKKITLEHVYKCLLEESGEIILDDEIINKAKEPLTKMLNLSK